MTALLLTSESGLTAVTVLMDEDTGIGMVRISTPNNPEQVIHLPGEVAGQVDAEPRSEVIERLEAEAAPMLEEAAPAVEEEQVEPEPEPEATEPEPEPVVEPVKPKRASRTRK